ncbi:MAG: hypothetical protein IPK97_05145 [Ahniella sp.]|nr:hypothetical protein [Ahniella sp.]
MLKVLHDNYRLVRRVLPHPVWFSQLTGIHPRVAGNVLAGIRKVSLRHLMRISESFALEAWELQLPRCGVLDAMDSMNLARQAWLRLRLARWGSCRAACQRFPGLGLKTIHGLLKPGAIVSPLMCQLVARHTGWTLPPGLLEAHRQNSELRVTDVHRLLDRLRLENHRVVSPDVLPKRTTLRMIAVAAEIRFAPKHHANLQAWIRTGQINPAIKSHRDWLLHTLREQLSCGQLSAEEVASLRRLVARRRWAKVQPLCAPAASSTLADSRPSQTLHQKSGVWSALSMTNPTMV